MFYPAKYYFLLLLFCLNLLLFLNGCNTLPSPHASSLSTQTSQPSSVYIATIQEDASSDLLALQADTGKMRWRRHIAVNTPALLATNTIIYAVGGLETLTGSRLYAFNSHDGGLLWQTHLKSFGLLWMQIAQGILYLAGPVDGTIYAIRTSDGALLWQKTLTNTSSFIALVLYNNLLYATSFRDGTLYALQARTGSLLWKYQSPLSVLSKPYLMGSHLYLRARNKSASQGALFALDALRGMLLWQYRSQNAPLSSLTFVGAQIVVTSVKSELASLSVQDGAVLWKTIVGAEGELSTPLPINQQIMIVNTKEHALYVLNQSTGAQLWQKSIACSAVHDIEQIKGRLYLLDSNNGLLCAIQSQNARELWHIALISGAKPASFLPLFLVSGYLYTVSPDTGFLYALRQTDGALAWQYNLGAFESGIPAPVTFAP